MNANPIKIGQAIMSVIRRKNDQVEVTFNWVQPGRGEDFDKLVGLSPTYEDVTFPVSTVRLGNRNAGETQPIMFVKTGKEERFVNKGVYSGLIGFHPSWTGPEIICIASKTEFDSVVEAFEAQKAAAKATFSPTGPKKTKRPVNPSWTKPEEVDELEEDLTVYKVDIVRGGQKIGSVGTLKEIVAELTTVLKKDPTDSLHAESTDWQMKGVDNRYRPSLIPAKIPSPPASLLALMSKAGKASA